MLALGGLLIGVTILALGLLIPISRDPEGPSWASGELITVTLVTTFALGLGYLGAGAIAAFEQGLDPIDTGLLLAIVVATALLWRRLNVRGHLRAIEARSAAAPVPPLTPANDVGGPEPKRPTPAGSSGSRREAA